MNKSRVEKREQFVYTIPRFGAMKVPVTLFLSESLLKQVEEEAIDQIVDAACLDEDSSVLATPDIHTGYGVPIGSVLATAGFISPSAVGYDINCGMRLLSTPFEATEAEARRIAEEIARCIPLGEGKKNLSLSKGELKLVLSRGLDGLESVLPRFGLVDREGMSPYELFNEDRERTEDRGSLAGSFEAVPEAAVERGLPQLGTLGGGNHFLEIQRVASIENREAAGALGLFEGQLTCMIHSGSRGLGHEVAGQYMRRAKAYLKEHGVSPPNGQLLFFPAGSREGRQYLGAMNGAANYAFANREVMALLIRGAFGRVFGPSSVREIRSVYDVTHNMAKEETVEGKLCLVHRKGATRAFDGARMKGTGYEGLGQPVLIPGSMGTSSYVLLGHPGSARSLFSVNHGAGRVMSRTQAAGKGARRKGRKGRGGSAGLITDEDFRKSMEGVHLICEDRRRIKEEAPGAYKDIDEVIRVVLGAGLALPVARLVPLAVLKG
ncbi:MAG TPA: RtcB family protein [Spirochaetia bacterium]|nr:RtcB family protein [Spirochaetia bacterium]